MNHLHQKWNKVLHWLPRHMAIDALVIFYAPSWTSSNQGLWWQEVNTKRQKNQSYLIYKIDVRCCIVSIIALAWHRTLSFLKCKSPILPLSSSWNDLESSSEISSLLCSKICEYWSWTWSEWCHTRTEKTKNETDAWIVSLLGYITFSCYYSAFASYAKYSQCY